MALAIIMAWYGSIGVLAAAGSMNLSGRLLPARHEATLYGSFLIAIAAFYLVSTAYFGDAAAWPLETAAVVAFSIMGVVGTRVPVVLIAGYVLHGGWDLLHEGQAQLPADLFGGRVATRIPLGYGAFCTAFDWVTAGYFWHRRRDWAAAWRSGQP